MTWVLLAVDGAVVDMRCCCCDWDGRVLTSWYVVWSLVRLVLLMASAIALVGFSVGFFIVVIVGLMDDIIVDRVLFDVS
jgi:hypothetical protein